MARETHCPNCGATNRPGATKYCRRCGVVLSTPADTCFNCGSPLPERAKFCEACGSFLIPSEAGLATTGVRPRRHRRLGALVLVGVVVLVPGRDRFQEDGKADACWYAVEQEIPSRDRVATVCGQRETIWGDGRWRHVHRAARRFLRAAGGAVSVTPMC